MHVDQALELILQGMGQLSAEIVDLTDALGRVLAEDVQAEISLPPFANSSMDGYAVRAADVIEASENKPIDLRVVLNIPAGTAPQQSIETGEAARIMTGAPVPDGADAIVPVEGTAGQRFDDDNSPLPDIVRILRNVQQGAYIRPVGEDIERGAIVLRAGAILRPQEIGMLAALGQAHVSVVREPRVAILSTGNELVKVDEALTPGKIRDTNSYTLYGLVKLQGGQPIRLPIAGDTLQDVRHLFLTALEQHPDLIISSAGVSVGAADLVRIVLEELGKIDLWRINMRPGKPLAFGQIQNVPFFGLPGNPVSAMVTFEIFVRPAILKLAGREGEMGLVQAIVGEDIRSDGRRSYLRVRLTRNQGQWIAYTTGTQSSGALMSMVLADGLLIVPEGVTFVQEGTELPVRLLRHLQTVTGEMK
jgi:molybdopterin molybdotransferase